MSAVSEPEVLTAAAPLHRGVRHPGRVLGRGIRSVLFWSHLVLGVAGGLVIGVMSLTGVLLAYERQVIAAVDGRVEVDLPAAAAERLPLDTLLSRAAMAGGAVATVVVNADPRVPVQLRLADRSTISVDPYRGTVLPAREPGRAQRTMSFLRGWHRWLGAEAERRPVFRAITGASNAAFLLLLLTGSILWLPRRLSLAAWVRAVRVRTQLRGRARDWNWHTTTGAWLAVPLGVVIVSGLFISYKWPGRLLDRIAGSAEERAAATAPPREPSRASGAAPDAGRDRVRPTGLDRWMTSAAAAVPGWAIVTITMPAPMDSLVRVTVARANTYRPDRRTQLQVRNETGAVVVRSDYRSLSVSRRLQGWVRFGHTGEVFGAAGQTVALLASAAGLLLVWTGLALSWHRLAAWRARRRR